jgi:6-pyruvoyltetrahydropterin/6-carboxytetrahydropterin synthase
MLVTRRFKFSSSLRLYDAALGPEENRRRFGERANPHGHGHNFILEVSVRGPVAPDTGMVINLKDLKALVDEAVIRRYHHRHLNDDTPDFDATPPTVEQIACTIFQALEGRLPGVALARVRLWQDEDTLAEVSA